MAQVTIQQAFELAVHHHQAGRLPEAEQLYRQILAHQPNHAPAILHLGMIAHQIGRDDVAVELIRQAIAFDPMAAEAHFNLGVALKNAASQDEEIAAYREAIRLNPKFANAYSNLGVSLKNKGQLDEAIAAYREAIALDPNCPEAHNNLANARKDKGQLDEAIAAYRRAFALRPSYAEAHSNLILALHYHPGCDATSIAKEQRRWDLQHAEPLKRFNHSHSNHRRPDKLLRIGYVSADFRSHASAYFLVNLLENHDSRQMEVFVYADVLQPDEITRRVQQRATQWRNIVGLSDAELAETIYADGIDLLVDLKLHTANNRLLVFARKPAPVQVSWLGYPGSTGVRAIDYRLSDPYLDPPGMDESVYSEQTIRLPDTFWCYDPLDNREIPVNSLPAQTNGFITFGCLNSFFKINDHLLVLWARVLRQVQASRLLLLAPEGTHRQKTLVLLHQEGIDRQRVEFFPRLPRRKYMELYHRIDVGLDSFPYNGHTTSLDSFWMGVPVVTLVGKTAVSRAGWCQLSNLSLSELAGHDEDQFVRIAVDLANDLPRLGAMRSTLRQRMEQSPLMDAPSFAGNVEVAYWQMWHTWCNTALP